MEKSQFLELQLKQNEHWWFQGKKEIITDFLSRICTKDSPSAAVLDVGCGMGLMLDALAEFGQVYGCDIEPEAVEFCRRLVTSKNIAPEEHIQCGSLPDAIPMNREFDVIVALDVLEHVEDDCAAMRKLYTLLSPQGVLIVTVPAHMSMWSGNDVLNHHFRRYEKKELEDKLKQTGFQIEKLSFYNSYLFLPAYVIRKLKNALKLQSSDIALSEGNTFIGSILKHIFASEKYYLRKHNFPTGVSLIAVLTKKAK